MLKLHFPYTIYGKRSGPSNPHWPTPQSPSGADSNEDAALTLQSPGCCLGHTHSAVTVGQAPSLQLWSFRSESHRRGPAPRLLCLLATGWLPAAIRVHILPGSHPEGKRKEREKNALSQHGMQIIPVCMRGSTESCGLP